MFTKWHKIISFFNPYASWKVKMSTCACTGSAGSTISWWTRAVNSDFSESCRHRDDARQSAETPWSYWPRKKKQLQHIIFGKTISCHSYCVHRELKMFRLGREMCAYCDALWINFINVQRGDEYRRGKEWREILEGTAVFASSAYIDSQLTANVCPVGCLGQINTDYTNGPAFRFVQMM